MFPALYDIAVMTAAQASTLMAEGRSGRHQNPTGVPPF